jgi:hypothetical protein
LHHNGTAGADLLHCTIRDGFAALHHFALLLHCTIAGLLLLD